MGVVGSSTNKKDPFKIKSHKGVKDFSGDIGSNNKLGGGNSNVFLFSPYLGTISPIWRAYFSDGLVQPPTR